MIDTLPNSSGGPGAFHWFHGVVEDIMDPHESGRIRVRCIGYHTDDRTLLPTGSLPWATPILPVTSASMSSVGRSPTGILPGSWVIGFFRDGFSAQDPIVIGTIPSFSTKTSGEKGFSDPRGVYPLKNGVDTPTEGTSSFVLSDSYKSKVEYRQEGIEKGIPPETPTVSSPKESSYYERGTWSVPDPSEGISPIYPKNHVFRTESGHVMEFDDTPGAARISEFHNSGSYREILSDGSSVLSVVGNSYRVVFKDNNVYIKGSCNLTVDGTVRTLVKGDYHLEVEGDMTENIKGSKISKIGGSKQSEIGFEKIENITSNHKVLISGFEQKTVHGSMDLNVNSNLNITVANDSNIVALSDMTLGALGTSGVLSLVSAGTSSISSEGGATLNSSGVVTITGTRINLN